jgi:signal transduction histidine kinase
MNRAVRFRRRLGIASIALTAFLFFSFYLAFRTTNQTEGMNYWVNHTQEVIGLVVRVRLERDRLTNEIWGYRASRNAELPANFQSDVLDLKADLRRLRKLTMDNQEQQTRALEMERIILAQLPELEQAMLRALDSSGTGSPGSLDWSLPTLLSEQLRMLFDQMESRERELLKERIASLHRNTEQTHVVLVLAALITSVALSAGLYLAQREILKRAAVEQGLRQAQTLLGGRYDQQRAELTHVVEDLHEQIVERRAAEEKLSLLNMELEERVKERTGQLEEMNKEMESFSYSVSHDLRAPLRHMQGFSRILMEQHAEHLPEDARQYLERIRNASTHMAALVEDLLHLSKLGRQVAHYANVPTRELVEAVRAEAVFEAAGREIVWKVGVLPDVYGDALLLRQVLANLLANAVKFTRKQQHAVIEIGYRREGRDDVFFVRDNGAGFDPRYADKLFGVFQRLHRQDEFEGTGIGLTTVQRIMHKHGGKVWAESQPGNGAIFYFSLPTKQNAQEKEKRLTGALA